ncbi:hypothetical protein [Streptomyces sp. NPDC006610]
MLAQHAAAGAQVAVVTATWAPLAEPASPWCRPPPPRDRSTTMS